MSNLQSSLFSDKRLNFVPLAKSSSKNFLPSKSPRANPGINSNLDKLFKEIDKGLSLQVIQLRRTINEKLDELDSRIKLAESNIQFMVREVINRCESDLTIAENLVQKELRSKILTSQWTSTFLSDTTTESIDPVTFAYSRFAYNICFCYKDVDPLIFEQSKVHEQLVSNISLSSEMIVGPSLMALVHLSLLPEMRAKIVDAGALSHLLKIMTRTQSKVLLAQACKLLASLAIHFPNKGTIVVSGCFHAVVDLILGTGKNIIPEVVEDNSSKSFFRPTVTVPKIVQYYALAATANIVNGSDANRTLALELRAVYPTIYALNNATSSDIVQVAAETLANIAFNNVFAGSTILSHSGDRALLMAIQSGNILRDNDVTSSCLTAIGNMCTNETNQSHIGAKEAGATISAVIRICEHAQDTRLVANSARTLLSLGWKHVSNKARIATQGATRVLLKRIIHHSHSLSSMNEHLQNESDLRCIEDEIVCLEYLCAALASMLLNKWTQSKFNDVEGVREIVRSVNMSSSPRVLRAMGMVIVAMVPSPEDLLRYHTEAHQVSVETANALPALKKIRVIGYGNLPSAPIWLETAVLILTKNDHALSIQSHWDKTEFVESAKLFKDFTTDIQPEWGNMADSELRGFLYSLH